MLPVVVGLLVFSSELERSLGIAAAGKRCSTTSVVVTAVVVDVVVVVVVVTVC